MTSASLTHLSLSGMRQIMEQKHDRSPRAEATCISVPVPTHLLYQTLTSYSTCLSHSSLIMSSRDHKSIYPRGQLLRICTKVLSMVLAHQALISKYCDDYSIILTTWLCSCHASKAGCLLMALSRSKVTVFGGPLDIQM